MKKQKGKNKVNKTYCVLAIVLLLLMSVIVTYQFIGFVNSEVQSNERPGRLSYKISPSDTITLTNVYPITNDELLSDTVNNKSITINIYGSTNYDEDVEYLVKFDQVKNAINDKRVPIAYIAASSDLGEESTDYFNERGYDKTIYQISEMGWVYPDEALLVGYIKKGESDFSGTVTLTAYVDSTKIDTFGEEEFGDINSNYFFPGDEEEGTVLFTPEEWDEIMNLGVSFKVKVEIQKGTWVVNQ